MKDKKLILENGTTVYRCANCKSYFIEDEMTSRNTYCKPCKSDIDKIYSRTKRKKAERITADKAITKYSYKYQMINGEMHTLCFRCKDYKKEFEMSTPSYCYQCMTVIRRERKLKKQGVV